MAELDFYGNMDKDVRGKIQSQYPAWYFDQFIEELEHKINQMDNQLKMGLIHSNEMATHRMELEELKVKRDNILQSKPNPSQGESDRLKKLYKEFSTIISDTMFTLSEMKMGTADAHQEAKFMMDPVIPVEPKHKDLFKAANAKIIGGKASRNSYAKVFKVIGKLIGEPTNIEVLRKDKPTGRRPGSKKGMIQ